MIPDIKNSLIYLMINQKSFLLRRTLRFSSSYYDPVDTYSLFLDGKNGA